MQCLYQGRGLKLSILIQGMLIVCGGSVCMHEHMNRFRAHLKEFDPAVAVLQVDDEDHDGVDDDEAALQMEDQQAYAAQKQKQQQQQQKQVKSVTMAGAAEQGEPFHACSRHTQCLRRHVMSLQYDAVFC